MNFLRSPLMLAGLAIVFAGCNRDRGYGDPYRTAYIGEDGTVHYSYANNQQPNRNQNRPEPDNRHLFEWYGDNLTGATRVVINLTTQRAEVFIGGQKAGWTVVATGKEGYGTPAGSYKVIEKVVDKRSNLYGQIVDSYGNVIVPDADVRDDPVPPGGAFIGASMPYWMRLTNSGIGMHAGPIPRPGEPASHGCIRLPYEMAVKLHHRVVLGTPVRIVR